MRTSVAHQRSAAPTETEATIPVSKADRLPLHAKLIEVLGQRDADTLMELLRPPEGWPDDIDANYAAYDEHPIDSSDE